MLCNMGGLLVELFSMSILYMTAVVASTWLLCSKVIFHGYCTIKVASMLKKGRLQRSCYVVRVRPPQLLCSKNYLHVASMQ